MSNHTLAYTVETISLEDVQIDEKFNVRGSVGDVSELSASIKAQGLMQPVAVAKRPKGKYKLVEGFRRVAACGMAGVTEVQAKVYGTKVKQGDLFLANLLENAARENLNPMEEALGCKRLLESGFSVEDIVTSLGWTQTRYTQRTRLLDMSPAIQAAVLEERITVRQASAIADLPEDEHSEFVDDAAEMTINGTRQAVNARLEALSGGDDPGDTTDGEDDGLGKLEPLDDDDDDDFGGEDEGETIDPADLQAQIVADLADVLAKTDGDDSEAFAKHLVTVRAISFIGLDHESLSALAEITDSIVDKLDARGLFDALYDTEAEDEDEGEELEELDLTSDED